MTHFETLIQKQKLNPVRYQDWNQVYWQVVLFQVRDQIWDQVYRPVNNRDRVWVQVRDQIQEDLQ
jgi:hypothetical protein